MTKECFAPKLTWEKLCEINSFIAGTVVPNTDRRRSIFSLYALKLSFSTYVLSIATRPKSCLVGEDLVNNHKLSQKGK